MDRHKSPPWGCYFTAEQVRALDSAAMASGWDAFELMQRAGLSAWQYLRQCWPDARRIAVVLGVGNNAGDGYVLARHAALAGCHVDLLAVSQQPLRGAALQAAQAANDLGLKLSLCHQVDLSTYDVLVDALLGTGARGSPRPVMAAAIAAINNSRRPVLALDLPSGIDADTGNIGGEAAVRATHCISFVGAKRGLYTAQGDHHSGSVVVDDLGIEPDARILSACRVHDLILPTWEPRQRSAHKGNYGHVLVLGGHQGMSGAAMLAARAAARAGAGWVSVGAQATTVQALALSSPEIMAREVEDDGDLELLLQRATRIVLGPGLGRDAWSERLYERALVSGLPLVIDADALHLLAAQSCRLPQAIMTPHPGEAAALLGMTSEQVQADRFSAAAALYERYGAIVVLKGNGTLITHAGGTAICRYGNPGMATAGMGDVLAGLIGALWAQGLEAYEAAGRAVMVHARTADKLSCRGERGLMASDLSENWQEELALCR